MAEKKNTLTVEIAQRMYKAGQKMPETSSVEVRTKYEAMAIEARTVMAERFEEYTASVVRICIEKKHVGSTPPAGEDDTGTPCAACRKQVRYMRSAIKIAAPAPGE